MQQASCLILAIVLVLSCSGTVRAGIVAPPTFEKTFMPGSIILGDLSQLVFTVTDVAQSTVTGLAFTDILPPGAIIATPPNLSTTCTGGTLTAVAGGGVISYSGGSLSSGSCTISVDVMGVAEGTHVNVSGDLTSSLGNSGVAVANLVVPEPNLLWQSVSALGVLGLLRRRRRSGD